MNQKQGFSGVEELAAGLLLLAENRVQQSYNEDDAALIALNRQIMAARHYHAWFAEEYVRYSIRWLSAGLTENSKRFSGMEPLKESLPLAFWMRPLYPLEGAGEVLYAAFRGYRCLIKIAENDKRLLEAFFDLLDARISGFAGRVEFIENQFPPFSGMVLIGEKPGKTANSYLTRYPLLEFSGNDVAVLRGDESAEQIRLLAEDICIWFGRSRFNIKKLRVPAGYDFGPLFSALAEYGRQAEYANYFNHYEYQKSSMILGKVAFHDTGSLLLTEDTAYSGKIAVLQYEYYDSDFVPVGFYHETAGRCRNFFRSGEKVDEFCRAFFSDSL